MMRREGCFEGGKYSSQKDMKNFITNLSNTRLPSENADDKTREMACEYIDAIHNFNKVLRTMDWKVFGKPWTQKDEYSLREAIRGGQRLRAFQSG